MSGFDFRDWEEEQETQDEAETQNLAISREQIELSTIDEDPVAVANVAMALQKAGDDFTGAANLTQRAEEIKRARDRVGGEEVLQFGKSAFGVGKFIVDNILATANTVGYGLGLETAQTRGFGEVERTKTKDGVAFSKDDSLLIGQQKLFAERDRYSQYYDKLRKEEGRSSITAGFLTAQKVFEETPELRDKGSFVKEVLERFNDNRALISSKEAAAVTALDRPDAGLLEDVAALAPEVVGFTAASLKFLFRNSKDIIKKAEDFLDGEGVKIADASEDQIRRAVEKVSDQERFRAQSLFRMGNMRRQAFRERAATVIMTKRAGGLKRMPALFFQNTVNIQRAKSKLAKARTAADKKLIDDELDVLNSLRRKRLDELPKGVTDVVGTELVAAAGGQIAVNYFGEEYGWIGALGGGVTGGLSISAVYKLARGTFQGLANFTLGTAQSFKLLSNEQFEEFVTKGILPKGTDLSRNQEKALNSLATFVRSLPQDQRRIAFGQLKFFSQIKDDLMQFKDADGKALIDEELIDTTVGSAMGIVPLMMIRQAISDRTVDASKGVKALDDELKQIIESTGQSQKAIEQFRKLVDQLSGRADDVGYQNEKFTGFVDSMRDFARKEGESISQEVVELEGLVKNVMNLAQNPAVSTNAENLEGIQDLITTMLSNNLLVASREGATAAQRQLTEQAIPQLQKSITESFEVAEDVTEDLARRIEGFVTDYLDPEKGFADVAQASKDLAVLAATKFNTKVGIGKGLFEKLRDIDVEIDVTDYLRALFREVGDAGEPIIARTKKEKALQKLSRRRIGDAATLEAFADASAKTNIEEVLETNKDFADEIRTALNEMREEATPAVGDGYKPTFEDVKKVIAADGKGEPSDFEVFLSLLDYGVEGLAISMKPIDIQNVSSGFLEAAAANAKNRKIASKYSNLASKIIDQIDDGGEYGEAKQAILDAKSYWKNNVIATGYDDVFNPLGRNVAEKSSLAPKDNLGFVTNPARWIDFDKLMEGDEIDGQEMVEQIKRTFGNYNRRTGEWTILPETQRKVTMLMDSLLSKHLSDMSVADEARYLRGEVLKGTVRDFPERRLGALKKAEKAVQPKTLRSAALEQLEKEGLLNLGQVAEYNRRVDVFYGKTELLQSAKTRIDGAVQNAAATVRAQIKQQENVLKEINKFTTEQEGAKTVVDYDSFFQFFVESPMSTRRIKDIKEKLTQKGAAYAGKEAELDSVMSDITMESISRGTYGTFVEGTQAGTGGYSFDSFKLFEVMNSPDQADALRLLIPDKEKFEGIQKLSQLLMIQTREAGLALQQAGVNVKVPRGLSVESLLSRVYSISRGVISPKYVATEVALLNLRKVKGQAFVELLNDPKMVDELIEILETEGDVTREFNTNAFTVIINSLAKYDILKSEDRRATQMEELRQFKRSQ